MREALNYLAHAYDTNATLLKNGDKRGVDKALIAVYRRKCLTVSAPLCSVLMHKGSADLKMLFYILVCNRGKFKGH